MTDYLEIIIPTYNRARYLDSTLAALRKSPFRDARITVLDNASTDDTFKVSEYWIGKFSDLIYRRNPQNIGGELNYCLAVEISTGPYVWVIGDDDQYCWEYGVGVEEEFISALIERKVDIILPGITFDKVKSTGYCRIKDLLNQQLYFTLSFAPAVIFKRELYTETTILKAMSLSDKCNLLPMIPFVNRLINLNVTTYVSPTKTIDKGRRHGYSTLRAMIDWFDLSVDNSTMRREMFGKSVLLKNIVAAILCEPRETLSENLKELSSRVKWAWLFYPLKFIPLKLSAFDGKR
jgi:glycosyltransferase involved in cell wall biosynthesis